MKLILVSGLSGAGKTITLQTLEDVGYYRIDSLPIALLESFCAYIESNKLPHYENVAIGLDVLNDRIELESFNEVLRALKTTLNRDIDTFFLKARHEVLLQRFHETRRKHKLSDSHRSLSDAIHFEFALLDPFCKSASLVIDTSNTRVPELKQFINQYIKNECSLAFLIQSFGFKHGVPKDADFVFDVRCLPNPYWEPTLRLLTGHDEEVIKFMQKHSIVQQMLDSLVAFLNQWLPRFDANNRCYFSIALGCTGGHHRSVYVAEQLANYLRKGHENIVVKHRELE